MIAHAHVSIGRDYMLYRPSGGDSREEELIDDLDLQPIDDQADPMVLKIELWREDKFQYANDLIKRIEQITLKKVADSINLSHNRIR